MMQETKKSGDRSKNITTTDSFKSEIRSTKFEMVRSTHHPEPSRRTMSKYRYQMFSFLAAT